MTGDISAALILFIVIAVGIVSVGLFLDNRNTQNSLAAQKKAKAALLHPYFITVSVPSNTSWKPAQAQGLMSSLFQLGSPLSLQIHATSRAITWRLYLPDAALSDTISRSILSFYPQADIAVNQTPPVIHGTQTILTGTQEFFAPLTFADELKSLDPLVGIVGAMSNLAEGEMVTYQLNLTPNNRNYNQEGWKKIHKSPWPGLAFGLLGAALDATDTKRTTIRVQRAPPSLEKYETRSQQLFEHKLRSPLLPVALSFYVKSPKPERWRTIFAALLTTTSVFDRDDGNALTTQEKGHPLVLCPQEITALWHLPSDQIQTQGVVRTTGTSAPLPVELMQQTGDMLLGHNTYQGQTRPIYLADPDRVTHMNIVGKTRVGKTTFMHNLIHQDIDRGNGVAVIDPHGDLVKDILETSIPPRREQDVVLFDLADIKHPVPLNLLYVPPGVARHSAVGLTLGVMKKIFADQWSATRMEDALYSALAVLVDIEGATIRDIPKLFFDEDYRFDVLRQATDEVALEYWNEDFGRMSERYQMEVARPIMNRIRAFYRNPVIRAIVDQPTSLDLSSIMNGKQIFLASLAGEATQAEASILGALLISKIQMAAMSRANIPAEKRRMFYLYIDEVQNFITTSLSDMFSEAAKYALSLTVANQFLSQLEGGTLDAIIGNTGTTVMFACGAQDANDLGRYVKPVFDGQTLMNLDRFQTVVKMQHSGQTLPAFSMQTPDPLKKPADAAERVQRMKSRVHEDYNRRIAKEAPTTPEQQPELPEAIEVTEQHSDGAANDIPDLEM